MSKVDLSTKVKEVNRDLIENKVEAEASRLGLPYFDLRVLPVSAEILENFNAEDFFKYYFIPIKKEGKTLIIASPTPQSPRIQEFKTAFGEAYKSIMIGMISKISFEEKQEVLKKVTKAVPQEKSGELEIEIRDETPPSFEKLQEDLTKAEIQNLLKIIIVEGYQLSSSDIHIEPEAEKTVIRFRIDGVLHIGATLEKEQYKHLLSQIVLKANLKLNANYPQGGRFKVKFQDFELSVRIEIMPSLYGADIVIRIFNVQTQMLDLQELGIATEQLPLLESALMRPHGMILVVGPTGSGKTTTIYSLLNKLNQPEVKIITLEDPIEYTLPGTTQSQINEGEKFGDRLKAVLREDPDIIMVGEIRDAETAKTALQAAITGHLLITTLHANDTVTAVPRLIGLVEDASSFLDSVNLIIAQRLVREICPCCRTEYSPTESESAEIRKIIESFPRKINLSQLPKFFVGSGCDHCSGIGYKGRVGIFEFLKISPEFQKAASGNKTLRELKDIAMAEGMITMEQDGLIKAIAGTTSIKEVLKVIKE